MGKYTVHIKPTKQGTYTMRVLRDGEPIRRVTGLSMLEARSRAGIWRKDFDARVKIEKEA